MIQFEAYRLAKARSITHCFTFEVWRRDDVFGEYLVFGPHSLVPDGSWTPVAGYTNGEFFEDDDDFHDAGALPLEMIPEHFRWWKK